ncbi:GIY-YIG nuclease family protein [bacterium]|nr:GIY-YIG nuclease family protein [bacterium]RQV92088.1 MAG: GIY-YIG nuclease family protein [bacterium]
MRRKYYVYILTNKKNRVLYIGVTNNLPRRIWEHKQKLVKGFTHKYNCTKLIYFEETESVYSAIEREKQLKNWRREWKIDLISEMNPNWEDLAVKYHMFGEDDKDSKTGDAEKIDAESSSA